MRQSPAKWSAVGAWVATDVANTVFWMGIVGLAFPLWVTKEMGGNDATVGYTLSASMVVVLLAAPLVGAISDQFGRRVPMLVVATLICIGGVLLLGEAGFWVSLGLFALALTSMELGTILYNSLLTDVSTEDNRGTIAGLGVGIGYLGAFIAVGLALAFTDAKGYIFTIRMVGLVYLLFAVPLFIFLREHTRRTVPAPALGSVIRQAIFQVRANVNSLERFPGMTSFLLARFLYTMGIHTATAFAVLYAIETVELTEREIEWILIAGICVAMPSGLLWGRLVDRVGAVPVLMTSLLIWLALLVLAVGVPWLGLPVELWWAVGIMTGIGISGVFTADRPIMASFAPPQYVGEFFGLHGMAGKLGRVIGPFMWGFIVVTLDLGQPAALVGVIGCLLLSGAILTRLKAPVEYPSAHPAD